MAEKATGKAQGRSRPQAQAKGKGNQRQGKQGPDVGRGGGGSGGARGAANGTAARRGGGQRGQQSGRAGQERNRPRPREQEQQQDEQQVQQQDLSQDSGGGKVGDTLKQHPFTTAALGAGLTLLAAQGLRMALGGSGGNAQARGGEDEDEDSSGQASFFDADEDDEGEEEDDARGASASGEEDEEGTEEDTDDEDAEEGDFTSRLRQGVSRVGSALGGSGGAIRRGAQSGFQRGRQAADQNWQSHPLVMCGVALAVGAAAGFMLPRTRQEDRLMGEAADKVTGRLKKAVTESFRQGRTVAGKVVHEAVNATAKEAEREGLTPERLGKKVKRLVSHVREAVSNAVEEE